MILAGERDEAGIIVIYCANLFYNATITLVLLLDRFIITPTKVLDLVGFK